MSRRRDARRLPSALAHFGEIAAALRGRRVGVFLDYDGTLTPIRRSQSLARLAPTVRATVRALARRCPVVVVSGRDRRAVERLVRLRSLVYAGSHGFDIRGPGGLRFEPPAAARYAAALPRSARELRAALASIAGVRLEHKRFAVAVHYREAAPGRTADIEETIRRLSRRWPALRLTTGKKVLEVRPKVPWDKGRAVRWLRRVLGLGAGHAVVLYIGDDDTDEDALAVVRHNGIGILVTAHWRRTYARYRLRDPAAVAVFLRRLLGCIPPALPSRARVVRPRGTDRRDHETG